ncbi:MAG: hypothetical protein BWY32_01873 [bacterium ADurb.Bin243]|nr:MAG: hypothetical protein BWY32_01873 [bacterium ADurb.Bin243]
MLFSIPRMKISSTGRDERDVIRSRKVYVDRNRLLTASLLPALTGNLVASNVSGTTSLFKTLTAILAGAYGGYRVGDWTKEMAFHPGIPSAPLVWLGTVAAGSAGTGYMARRALDLMKRKKKRDR